MAELHNQLHRLTTVQSAYKKALGEDVGEFRGLERAGETLTPLINLWDRPEWELLRSEIIFSRVGTAAAVAARFSSVELVNPTGSGILAVVRRVALHGGTAQMSVDSGGALGVTTTTRGIANDTRYATLGEASVCTVVFGDLAAGIALPQDQATAAAPSGPLGSFNPYILAPGRKLFVIATAVLSAITVGLLWTERRALPGELE